MNLKISIKVQIPYKEDNLKILLVVELHVSRQTDFAVNS